MPEDPPSPPSRSRFAWTVIAVAAVLVALPALGLAFVGSVPTWAPLVFALFALAVVVGAGLLISRHEGRARRQHRRRARELR